MASDARVRLVVSGRVQGVGFRYSAAEAARQIGVAGWVRNLPDGSVEIVAQGSASAVARMTAWAWRGPRYASVDGVHVDDLPALGGLEGFEIRR
jgi:acylphosphatase